MREQIVAPEMAKFGHWDRLVADHVSCHLRMQLRNKDALLEIAWHLPTARDI